jgi:hypothetical protein
MEKLLIPKHIDIIEDAARPFRAGARRTLKLGRMLKKPYICWILFNHNHADHNLIFSTLCGIAFPPR